MLPQPMANDKGALLLERSPTPLRRSMFTSAAYTRRTPRQYLTSISNFRAISMLCLTYPILRQFWHCHEPGHVFNQDHPRQLLKGGKRNRERGAPAISSLLPLHSKSPLAINLIASSSPSIRQPHTLRPLQLAHLLAFGATALQVVVKAAPG